MEATDEVLMQAYVAGDGAAFEQLFARYAPTILGMGRRHLGSEDAARELVQQTFLRMHGGRHDYQQGVALKPWLMTIVMNLVRDQWRYRKRKPTTVLTHEPVAEPPADSLQRRQVSQAVRVAVAQLAPSQRQVVELHWLQEQPFVDVARAVGATEGAVRVRAHRAYKRLKVLLREQLEQDAT